MGNRRLMAASALLMTAALVTGCSEAEAVPSAGQMVLIAGDRQGMASIVDESGRDPEIVIASLRDQVMDRFDRDMTVSVIPADGDPRTAQTEIYELDTDNPTQRAESPEKRLEDLSENLADLQASSGESDVLSALDLGGRPTADSERKVLYVYDSGVSTAGPLAMQNGLLGPQTDVAEIVGQLQDAGNVPHLNGVEVHWWGMGQVLDPQATVPVWARTKLQELWTAVVEAGGGSVVFHDDTVQATAPSGDLPEVTPVTFSDVVAKPVSVTLPESQVSFQPDSADFADPAAAEQTLTGLVSFLESSSATSLWVTGCTANPEGVSAEQMQRLSEQRARTISESLKSAGLSTELHVQGLGPDCPGRTPEVAGSAGLEAAQAKNRRVLITSTELSPAALQG